MILNGLPWKWTQISLLFLRLHQSTASWTQTGIQTFDLKKLVVRKVNCNAPHTYTHTHRWGKPEGSFHLVKEQVRKMDLGFRHGEWWETCCGNRMTCNLCTSNLHKLLRQFVMRSNSQGLWFYHCLSEIAFCGPAAAKTTMATHADLPALVMAHAPPTAGRSIFICCQRKCILPAEESSISEGWIWGWHLRIVQAF